MYVELLRLKIDLHVHTVDDVGVPFEGARTIERILEAAKVKGLDGIALTDYYSLESFYRAKSIDSGLLILPGFEVRTDAGHVLVLGLEQLPPAVRDMGYEELVESARSLGGVTVLAHPAAGNIRLDRWRRCKPDAVEVLNAQYPCTSYFVGKGLEIAEELGLPSVGGSDTHWIQTVGDAYTVVETCAVSDRDVVEAVRAGFVRFEGALSPFSIRLKKGLNYLKYLARARKRVMPGKH